jgi:hypothetical protein
MFLFYDVFMTWILKCSEPTINEKPGPFLGGYYL